VLIRFFLKKNSPRNFFYAIIKHIIKTGTVHVPFFSRSCLWQKNIVPVLGHCGEEVRMFGMKSSLERSGLTGNAYGILKTGFFSMIYRKKRIICRI